MASAVPAIVAQARRRIVHHFETAGATAPEHAVAFAEPARRIERRLFRRMVDFGALVATSDGRYWLDVRRLADFRKEGIARILGVVALAAFAAAGAVALGG
jgi:hypothetical protein